MRAAPTVVFDLGEVLVASTGVLPALAAELRVPADRLGDAYWLGRTAYDLGGASEAYWTGVVEALGHRPEAALLRRLEEIDSTKWAVLPAVSAALLERLAADGVRMGVLSNAPAPLAATVRAAPWSAAFAHLVFSAEIAMAKPDPAAYAHTEDVLGIGPQDVVFFDDRVDNVAAARARGWDAHLWRDPVAALDVVSRRCARR